MNSIYIFIRFTIYLLPYQLELQQLKGITDEK